jgi:stress-induced morphogen
MTLKIEEINQMIKESIPDAEVTIEDLAGDENHYSATIKSKIFAGKSKIEQHKIVYKALKGKMGKELHALALNTIEL